MFFLLLWEKVLASTNIVSKYLQKVDNYLIQAGILVKELIRKLEEYRSDEAFKLFSEKANEITPEFDVPHCKNILDTILEFRGDSYFASLDKMLSALSERFENFFEVVSLFNILFPSHFLIRT